MSPLYAAARRGDLAAVAALLDAGADPNGPGDEHGTTALTVASFQGHIAVVRLLLARGADIDKPNQHGSRPLGAAARNERVSIISILLDAGASLTAEGPGGITAFMDAATMSPTTVRVFLDRGVDVNAVSTNGTTALECAAINRDHGAAIIRMLLEAGADPTRRNEQGQTAKDLAIERGAIETVPVLEAALSVPP